MCESTRILYGAELAEFTTFGIGGKARRLVITDDPNVLKEELVGENTILIGGGSNLLISDGGIDGNVVRFVSCTCEPRNLSLSKYERFVHSDTGETVAVYVSGAMRLSRLSHYAAEHGYSGLEWAAGIPGTVGGAVKMNAGAHGADIKSVLLFADIICGKEQRRLSSDELGLSYRSSDFGGVVSGAAFLLKKSTAESTVSATRNLLRQRRACQPSGKSAGCIYKAVNGVSAYKYIIGAGLSGYRVGGAEVSEKHANFIINTGEASAKDVIEIMTVTESEVYRKYGIVLEREIKILGDF